MKENYGYIYEVRCKVNNKAYIGKCQGLYNPNYYGSGLLIRNSLRKYGKDSFELPKVLTTAKDMKELNALEIYWIAEFRRRYGKQNIYNILSGGEGGDILTDHPNREEIIKKMIRSRTGHVTTEKTKQKIRLSMIGRNTDKRQSEDTKRRISEKLRGKPKKLFSDLHRQNISRAQKGIPKGLISEEHRENLRKARKEHPHKLNCICGCCRALRGENMFKSKQKKGEDNGCCC